MRGDSAIDPIVFAFRRGPGTLSPMAPADLPPCGLYRTLRKIGECDADRLVYFHNHGDPGPGLYFPERWTKNRAQFSQKGMTVAATFDPRALHALPREGFYRVKKTFHCCSKKCVEFTPEAFVQLGYNGNGVPLLFSPEWGNTGLEVPDRGTKLDDDVLDNLVLLQVRERNDARDDIGPFPRGLVVH
jgi:hypothetical protein